MKHNALEILLFVPLVVAGCDVLGGDDDTTSAAGTSAGGEEDDGSTGGTEPSSEDEGDEESADGESSSDTSSPPADRPSCEDLDPICAGESCCTTIDLPGGVIPVGRDHSPDDSTCPPGLTCLFNETPEHDVEISPFALDKYLVTVGRFRPFVDAWNENWRPSEGEGKNQAIDGTGWHASWDDHVQSFLQDNLTSCMDGGTWTDDPGANDDLPLTCVSWYEAMAFCIWDGGRIATEAEWEFAAGGGEENRPFPWGGAPQDESRLVYDGQPISAVGSKPDGAGRWGHLDLVGNAGEWVYDCWSEDFFGEPEGSADNAAYIPTGGEVPCPELDEVLVPQVPTFQLVVDQSGSMDDPFGGGMTRWEAMREALVGGEGVVATLQSQIRFGISLYRNEMGAGTCPGVQELAPQLDAQDEITTLLEMQMPGGDTPTGESLTEITASLLADDWEGEKVLVLSTDGEPDSCEVPDPMTMAEIDEARMLAIDAVRNAYDEGIRTFVISVGDEVGEDHLQDLANAGVGNGPGDPDATFWIADDTMGLIDAFNEVIAGIRPCEFTLDMTLTMQVASTCTVTVNGEAVPFMDPDGWTRSAEDEIELQGAACEAIQQGVAIVQMTCTCEE